MLPGCGSGGGPSPGGSESAGTDQVLQLVVTPSTIAFGNVTAGASGTQNLTLTSVGNGSVTVSQTSATGGGFSVTGPTLPLSLTAGASANFTAHFSPSGSGTATGSISVVSNASNSPLIVPLSGVGVTQTLSISPTSLAFGNITVGNSSTLPVVAENTGSARVTISQAITSGTGFSVSSPALPVTLAAGQNASFSVSFNPTVGGSVTGDLTIASNATNSPNVEALSATGVNESSVTLTWTASTSPNIAGYNVYRSTVSGGPYTILNSSVIAVLTYTDTSVQAGQTYYYVTTAVDSQGVECAYSNQAAVTVPSP
jgi:hypothetical protein